MPETILNPLKRSWRQLIAMRGSAWRTALPCTIVCVLLMSRSIGGEADISNVHGREEDGVTEIGFSIPLDSGDPMDGKLVPGGDTIVLLASSTGQDSFRARHNYRAKFKVNLSTGEAQKLN